MIAAIVQARMGSSRLPGKVLRQAAGKTFLEHLLERLGHARTLDRIVVATSTLAGDDPIDAVCGDAGVECFRGSERDVLDRYVQCARAIEADTVVRITADCPLIDPEIVDRVVAYHAAHEREYDLVTNRHPLTFPDGLDADAMSMSALEAAGREATAPAHREHVVPFFWDTGRRVYNVEHPENLFPRYRWTVDYEEDAQLVAAVFDGLYEAGHVFGLDAIRSFIDARPDLAVLNAAYLPQRPA